MALEHWSSKPDRQLAEMCGVSPSTVAKIRAKDVSKLDTSTTRTDSIGRQQPAHKGKTAYTDATSEPVEPVAPVKVPDGEMPSATAMINKIEGKKEIDMKPVNGMPEGKGVILANDAINILREIPKNDKLRAVGFKMVKDWINQHKEQ
jgi:hypothetical protein